MTAPRARRTAAATAALTVVATLLAAPAGTGAAEETATGDCEVTYLVNFSDGDHHDWSVVTAVEGGTPPWGPRQETISRGVALYADASGAAAKDTRLVAPPLLPTGASYVRFHHDRVLGPGDGMVLEVSTDGGASWQDAGHLLSTGSYDGATADGRPAWTGTSPAPLGGDAVPSESTVDLGAFAGSEVLLSWRLLQSDAAAPTPGGYVSLLDLTVNRVLDRDCVDGYTANPYARCLGTARPDLSVDTAENEDATPTWRRTDVFLGDLWTTGAQGVRAKDDRLVSAPFTVTPRTRVKFLHRYTLEPDRDGGTLEYSTDDGQQWEQVPSEWLIAGSYDGVRADGAAAWTGSFADHREFVRPSPEFFLTSVAVLGDLAGEEVRLRARLLQDPLRPGSAPGVHWSVFGGMNVLDTVVHDCTGPAVDGSPPPCDNALVPEATSAAGVTSSGEPLPLDVLVLLDVDEGEQIRRLRSDPETAAEGDALFEQVAGEAAGLLEEAQRAYDGVNVEIGLRFGLLGPLEDRNGTEMQELINRARAQLGGRVPADVDVVYTATDQAGVGLQPAGLADCVGGITSPLSAFAAGRLYRGESPSVLQSDRGAKVFGHEVAHLFGAHHHYANCAEAAPTYVPEGDLSGRCTMMVNDLFLVWWEFSTVSRAVVRGYAEAYLAD